MFGLGGGELVVIVLVALMVFGPKRLPEVVKGVARAYGEFQHWRGKLNNAVSDLRQEINIDIDEPLLKSDFSLTPGKPRPGPATQVPPLNPTTQNVAVPTSDDYLAPPAYDQTGDDPAGATVTEVPAVSTGTDDYLAGGGA